MVSDRSDKNEPPRRRPRCWLPHGRQQLTYVYDGATGALLKAIEYLSVFATLFFTGTVRQQTPPGIRAYLFASEFVDGNSGRVYYLPFTPIPKLTRLKAIGNTGNGFRLKLIGEPGRKLEVQASSDFKTWEPIALKTMGDQPAEVEDSAAARRSHRCYRALQSE